MEMVATLIPLHLVATEGKTQSTEPAPRRVSPGNETSAILCRNYSQLFENFRLQLVTIAEIVTPA